MAFANPLLEAWAQGRTTFGVWATMPGSVAAEFIARQGVDYVCVDHQHGLIDLSSGIPMIQAIAAGGAAPVVRARWNEPPSIMSALDAGAFGVVVPMVNNAEEARRAVAACRYPPHGTRSFGPVRAREVFGSSDPSVLSNVACIVMVETGEGIRNVHEIAATDGVDAIYIGPSDLSLSLGLLPNQTPPEQAFVEVVRDIQQACRDNGIAVGIQCANGELANAYREQGFDMITIGSDAPFLTSAVRAHLQTARGSGVAADGATKVSSHY